MPKRDVDDVFGAGCFLIACALFVAAAIGWVMNILKLASALNDPLTAMVALRAVGVVLAPVGAVLGWV